jgi:hypothetical protein
MNRQVVYFFTAIFLLGIVLVLFPKHTSEGFQSLQDVEHKMVQNTTAKIEEKAVNPEVAQAGVGSIEPFPLAAGNLPLQIVEKRAKGAPLPYVDPSTEYAKYIRIKAVLEDLQAFLAFEIQSLEDICDPSVQLPMSTLRADTEKLKVAVSVMDRNPGVKSTVTTKTLNDMVSNLQFLRDKRNLLVANSVIESFADKPDSDERATVKELQEFDAKLQIEKLRIGASGTTDPNVIARVAVLDRIHVDIEEILAQVKAGVILEDEIPIKKSDIENSLPNLADLSKPIPQAITKAGLPSWLLNMFPGGLSASDTTTLNSFRKVLGEYADRFFSNVNDHQPPATPNYKEKFQASMSNNQQSRDGLLASINPSSGGGQTQGGSGSKPPKLDGEFPKATGLPGYGLEQLQGNAGFNWKERASIIRERVLKRGLKLEDYGILPENTEVSDDYGWRGYTKMICSRLLTTTDPGLPEYVGCPPATWNGWSK